MTKKNAAQADTQHGAIEHRQHTDTSTAAQRQRLLAALRQGPVTTLDARQLHDVLHPAARVQELRECGNRIITYWTIGITSAGHPHRVAQYVLTKEAAA